MNEIEFLVGGFLLPLDRVKLAATPCFQSLGKANGLLFIDWYSLNLHSFPVRRGIITDIMGALTFNSISK